MFDIGFAELIIIGVVALLVIGPERLPEAVRTASAWINRLRRGFNDIKREVQQELHNDAVMRDLRDSGDKLRRESEALQRQFRETLESPPDPVNGNGDGTPAAPGADENSAGPTAPDHRD
jgi:sec-independent protein translocase protein TatB